MKIAFFSPPLKNGHGLRRGFRVKKAICIGYLYFGNYPEKMGKVIYKKQKWLQRASNSRERWIYIRHVFLKLWTLHASHQIVTFRLFGTYLKKTCRLLRIRRVGMSSTPEQKLGYLQKKTFCHLLLATTALCFSKAFRPLLFIVS